MPRKLTPAEREAFLAEPHIGIVSVNESGKPPFAVPVWYAYEPGGLVTVLTGPDTIKARLIKEAGGFTLVAQTEEPPYRYVSVSGPLVETVETADGPERLAVAQRYLGEEGGRAFMANMGEHPNVAFRMRPTRWLTQDLT